MIRIVNKDSSCARIVILLSFLSEITSVVSAPDESFCVVLDRGYHQLYRFLKYRFLL